MAPETKNLFTRSDCKKEIERALAQEVYRFGCILAVICLLLIPCSLLPFSQLERFSDPFVRSVIIALGLLFYLPIAMMGYATATSLIQLRFARKGYLVILTDTVKRLSPGEPRGRYSTADVLYFEKTGKYIPSRTAFQITSVGDTYYVVFLSNGKRRTPVRLGYPTKLYDCKETDDT